MGLRERPSGHTKFFASESGFVGDFKDEYLVVMGHVWVPQPILLNIDKDQLSSAEIVSAYVALFNSGPFVKLLSFIRRTSPVVNSI